jgi:hypothetical protein
VFIPLWGIALLLLALLAWSAFLLNGAWKAGQKLGEAIGREDLEIEQGNKELREALAPLRRHKLVKMMESQGKL